MINGVKIKVCGLTSLVDTGYADECGADYLGFNLHPPSPRYLSLRQFSVMGELLPPRKKVAITVEPTVAALAEMNVAGFDYFQVHFRPEIGDTAIAAWAETVGSHRLWLAPKLPPAEDVSDAWLRFSGTVMIDAFSADKFGGTGHTSDWGKFARHREKYPDAQWILAGGLSPENIGAALQASGARFVDVNSGVESAPGVKDHAKLARLVSVLRERRS